MTYSASNTLAVPRPTKDVLNKVKTDPSYKVVKCGDENLGPTDPLDKSCLGPRIKREKVREQVRDFVLLMLGAPVVDVELDIQQLDLCVDQALKIYEDYCPREYFDYYVFNTIPGQSVYEMPCEIGLIRDVFYREEPKFSFQSSDLDGAIPIEYFYPGGAYASIQGGLIDPIQPIWGRAGEWFMYKQYERLYSRLSSSLGGWEWVRDFKHIKLYPVPFRSNSVIVHYLQKMKDWNEVTEAMQMGALSYAKQIVGRIRSKYGNPPGPGGGIQLDGQQLLQESIDELRQWREDLIVRYGDLPYISLD